MHSNAWSRQGMACPQYRCVARFTQHRIAIKTADQAEHENEFSQHNIDKDQAQVATKNN